MTAKTAVKIRAGEYRGVQGFHVRTGPLSDSFCFGVFVETRKAAEMCKAAHQRGEDVTMDHLLGIEPLFWDTEAA